MVFFRKIISVSNDLNHLTPQVPHLTPLGVLAILGEGGTTMAQAAEEARVDDRKGIKVSPEAKRIWDIIAAALGVSRDEALEAEGRAILARLRNGGKLE